MNDDHIALEIREQDSFIIASLSGRLDIANAPSLENKLRELILSKHYRIILNCSHVTYLSSAGMRLLLAIERELNEKGMLALCSLTDEVYEIIKMAGFESVLKIYNNEEDALKALK